MIKKLRQKLIFMFLTSTMLAFTIMLLIIAGNTVKRVQESEITYARNLSDSVVEQIKNGREIDALDFTSYAANFHGWIYISDGVTEKYSEESFLTSVDILLKQMKSEVPFYTSISSSDDQLDESTQSIYSLRGLKGDTYYGVYSILRVGGDGYLLVLMVSQSTLWDIIRNDCKWYLLLWLVMFLLMYSMSRILIIKAIAPVKESIKSQKSFVAAASHELKAPLSVIQANIETLVIDNGDRMSRQKQKIMLDECERMAALIQSMLTLASSDAGNWNMNMKETDVDSLLIEVWEAFLEPARKKCISIKLEIEDGYPHVICDPEHIARVLGILLDNAISYSLPDLSVQMGARVQQKQLVFYVADHGPGIPDCEKEKVFERFYSGDPSRTDRNHFGLGLSIAQEIVQLHQGILVLKDTPKGGCTVEIHLPVE